MKLVEHSAAAVELTGGFLNWGFDSSAVSGMDDADRDHIWKNQKKLVGKIAEVKFRKVSEKDRLIEPRLVRLRPDKDAD